jgi:dihydrofolate reductase
VSVIVDATVSVDGFIAYPDDAVGSLFDWYGNGDTNLRSNSGHPFRVSRDSAAYVQPIWDGIGAIVMGRVLFDVTDGWGGVPEAGDHVFVVSHRPEPAEWRARFPDAPFTFVDNVPDAIARAVEMAGERTVSLCAGNVAGQALAAGLVDELCLEIAPVVLGAGKRYFGEFVSPEVNLDDPQVVVGDRVTHLRYRVRRRQSVTE